MIKEGFEDMAVYPPYNLTGPDADPRR